MDFQLQIVDSSHQLVNSIIFEGYRVVLLSKICHLIQWYFLFPDIYSFVHIYRSKQNSIDK